MLKKSLLSICLGATNKVSISAPGTLIIILLFFKNIKVEAFSNRPFFRALKKFHITSPVKLTDET